jgi:hypothetical protein
VSDHCCIAVALRDNYHCDYCRDPGCRAKVALASNLPELCLSSPNAGDCLIRFAEARRDRSICRRFFIEAKNPELRSNWRACCETTSGFTYIGDDPCRRPDQGGNRPTEVE